MDGILGLVVFAIIVNMFFWFDKMDQDNCKLHNYYIELNGKNACERVLKK